jgi:hypothetical protein
MTIKANILQAKARLKAGEQPYSDQLKAKALKAIYGGPADWVAYMMLFGAPDKPEQLARLVPTDGTENDAAMKEARAYLVAAGPCTPDTVDNFEKGVTDILDVGLAP